MSANIEDSYPLSPLQEGMLFHSLSGPTAAMSVDQVAFTLRGPLEVPAFERAWRQAIARHTILRTGFAWEGLERPMQVVHREAPFQLQLEDWRSAPEPERGARFDALLEEEAERPFDLAAPSLMRLRAARLEEREHRFAWTFHHLLLDGRSVPLLLSEMFTLYGAEVAGQPARLLPAAPFGRFIAWLERQDRDAVRRYWTSALAGLSSPTPVPGVRPMEAAPEGRRHGERRILLDARTTAALQVLARREGLTLNTMAQTAWAVVLARCAGQGDVCFGATVPVRPPELEGVESTIGLYVNTLPVRAEVRPEAPLVPWMRALQLRQTEARQFDSCSLVDVQGWSAFPRGQLLFESLLVFENDPTDQSSVGSASELQVSGVSSVQKTNFPLAIIVGGGERLSLLGYNDRARLSDEGAELALRRVATALESIAAAPGGRCADVQVDSEAERRRMLLEWNEPRRDFPRDATVAALFAEQARARPGEVALSDGARALTYGALDADSNRLARHLRVLGVGVEARIGLCAERSVDAVVAMLGILKAGGAYVPLDPGYPDERLAQLATASGLKVVVARGEDLERARRLAPEVVALDGAWRSGSAEPVDAAAPADALACVMFTSGSTGVPKGVEVVQRGIVRLVKGADYARLDASTVLLHAAPLSFDASTLEIWGALLNGGRVEVMAGGAFSLRDLASAIETRGVTTAWLTAGLFGLMAEHELPALRGLREVLAGGDLVPPEAVRAVLGGVTGVRAVNGYGPTENTTFTCCHAMAAWEGGAAVPLGRPIAGTRVYVLDERLRPVPLGAVGELFTGGDGLARGYQGDAALTAERFVPDPFGPSPGGRLYRTGDLVRWRQDGVVELLGRRDLQVKIRGHRVELGEVESALAAEAGVRLCAVIAKGDGAGDRRLVAYVAGAVDPGELKQRLRSKLPMHLVPSAIVRLEALPLTPVGKVDRQALARLVEA